MGKEQSSHSQALGALQRKSIALVGTWATLLGSR